MGKLTLSFLGAFQVTLNGRILTHFRSAKVQGLLVYLTLLPHQAHARDALATLFWPDEPEAVAKKNLRQSLYLLRRLLEDMDSEQAPFFVVTRATVQFNAASDHSLDVANFLAALAEGAWETAVSH